jgi:hypothetical protein
MHILHKGDSERDWHDVRAQDRYPKLLLLDQMLQEQHNPEKEDKQERDKAEKVKALSL